MFSAVAMLDGSNQALSGSAATIFIATADLTGASDTRTLTVCDAVREIMLLWGIENPSLAPDFARRRAINDLNAAMQTVWNRAKERDYWTRQTVNVTFAASTRQMDLGDDVQNVIGPARLSNRQALVPLDSRGDVDDFELAFLGEMSRDRTDGTPMAYFVERVNQSGEEPAKCVLHVAPAPESEVVVSLDVVKEAPRYLASDCCSGTLLAIPHKYVEALLLPVARYMAMSCSLFIDNGNRKEIEAGFELASAQLDAADPHPTKE